jgi:hypothetical protein
MQVPLVIPELNYVTPVDLASAATEVHAFRVDVTDRTVVNIDHNFHAAGGGVDYYELTPMRVSSSGTTPLEWEVSCAYGWRFVGMWDHWPTLTTHSVAVRLYRRGYETVELRPDQKVPDDWKEATDLEAQEKAIDALLGVSPLASTSPLKPLAGTGKRSAPALELGTISSGHHKALLFAAGEYEWLAQLITEPDAEEQAIRVRLVNKAKRLHELADGKV